VFWQREYYLEITEHELAYKSILPTYQHYHDIWSEWELLTADMYYKQQELFDKNPIVSHEHEDLIFENA
jgi:hypothetical protein